MKNRAKPPKQWRWEIYRAGRASPIQQSVTCFEFMSEATVRVRMLNHLHENRSCWGEEIAATFEMASSMVGLLAAEFSIPQECISMKISMQNYRDGVFH